MKEGYLQTKIREQSEQIKILSDKIELLEQTLKAKTINKYEFENFLEKHRKEQMRVVFESQSLIAPIFDKLYAERVEFDIKKLNSIVNKQIEDVIKSNKDILTTLCNEVVLQRKDLGVVLSLLTNKKIISSEDINIMDKKVREEMDELGMRNHIFDTLYPKIKIQKTKIMGD